MTYPTNGVPLREQLREARQKLKLAQTQRQLQLVESINKRQQLRENYADASNFVGPYQDLIDNLSTQDGRMLSQLSIANDRAYGANWPFWRTWTEHALLRGAARILCTTNNQAQGALNGLTSYVIGEGFEMKAHALSNKRVPDGMVAAVQKCIDETTRLNKFKVKQKELFRRSRRDGEFFVRGFLHPTLPGRTIFRTVDPPCVIDAAERNYAEGSFGIITPNDPGDNALGSMDIETVEAIYVSYSGSTGDGEEVPSSEIVHFKRNVDDDVKRGLTDFVYDTYTTIKASGRLLDNMAEGSAVQAAIALVIQHDAALQAEAKAFADEDTDAFVPDITGRRTRERKIRSGEVLQIPKGFNFAATPYGSGLGMHTEVAKVIMQSVAVKWNAPAWLISGDVSSNSYTNAVEAKSPFVNRCKSEQEDIGYAFADIYWIAVRNCCESGRMRDPETGEQYAFEDIRECIEIGFTPPTVETRNKLEEANTRNIELQAGVTSRQKWSAEIGNDWEEVSQDNEEYQERNGGQPGQLPMPGDKPGQPQNGQQGTQEPQQGESDDEGMPGAGQAGLLGEEFAEAAVPHVRKSEPDDKDTLEADDAQGHSHDDLGRFSSKAAHASKKAHEVTQSVAGFSGKEDAEAMTAASATGMHNANKAVKAGKTDAKLAREHHRDAAVGHEDAAEVHRLMGTHPNHVMAARLHDKAAKMHREAAKAYESQRDTQESLQEAEAKGGQFKKGGGRVGAKLKADAAKATAAHKDAKKEHAAVSKAHAASAKAKDKAADKFVSAAGKHADSLDALKAAKDKAKELGAVARKKGATKAQKTAAEKAKANVEKAAAKVQAAKESHGEAKKAHGEAVKAHKPHEKAKAKAEAKLGKAAEKLSQAKEKLKAHTEPKPEPKKPASKPAEQETTPPVSDAVLSGIQRAINDAGGNERHGGDADRKVDPEQIRQAAELIYGKPLSPEEFKQGLRQLRAEGAPMPKSLAAHADAKPSQKPAAKEKPQEKPAAKKPDPVAPSKPADKPPEKVAEKPPERPQEKPAETPQEKKPLDLQHKDPNHPVAKAIAADTASNAVVAKLTEHHHANKLNDELKQLEETLTVVRKRMKSRDFHTMAKASKDYSAISKRKEEIAKQMESHIAAAREALVKHMAIVTPQVISTQQWQGRESISKLPQFESRPLTSVQKDVLPQAVDFVRRITESRGKALDVDVNDSYDGRAYARKVSDGKPAVIGLGMADEIEAGKYSASVTGAIMKDRKQSLMSSTVHEFGHTIEYLHPEVEAAAQAFIAYRCGDEPETDMKDFGMPGEMGRKDEFDKHFKASSAYYIGKVYRNTDGSVRPSTEVISMGIQALHDDPSGFCAKDPEYAQFVIGILKNTADHTGHAPPKEKKP